MTNFYFYGSEYALSTLIVDGRKLSVGTEAAFRNLIDLKGITLQAATDEDIATLTIHPGTPFRVRQQIEQFIQSRKQRTGPGTLHPARQQRRHLLSSRGKR